MDVAALTNKGRDECQAFCLDLGHGRHSPFPFSTTKIGDEDFFLHGKGRILKEILYSMVLSGRL